MKNVAKISLNGEWYLKGFDHAEGEEFKAFSPDHDTFDWMSAEVPGVVHLDLIKAKKIADPFYRMEELSVSWIEAKDWWYRKDFSIAEELMSKEVVEIRFDGLDTFATIWLNGQVVGKTDNMFLPWSFNVKRFLKSGRNTLVVKLESPTCMLSRLEAEKGKLWSDSNAARVYGRKTQYSFGWDWGPTLPTSGIWRKVELLAYDTAIINFAAYKINSLTAEAATLQLEAEVHSTKEVDAKLTFEVSIYDKKFTTEVFQKLTIGENLIQTSLDVLDPKIWWPAGYGEQHLYNLKATLESSKRVLDSICIRIGLRNVELLQQEDPEGKSFIFLINNTPIFCKGANWIPSDSFLPRITRQDYETFLDLAIKANMNMLRVWGGGIYENEEFYELCDKKGILVWQDFMFACGLYPEEEWFLNMVRKEAEIIIKRLRNYTSIVLWCGNNENDWIFEEGWFGKKERFSGEIIYHRILPQICARLDPTRPYWPSSPFGGENPNSEEIGDRHNWDVWNGWQDYTAYEMDKGRFISEFGFQALPTMQTIESFTKPEDRWPQSKVIEHHNKKPEGTERLYRFLAAHYRVPSDFRDFVLINQINQGEALKFGIEHWRRRKFATSGTLIWQFNDCWPATSWSLVDYFKRPKPGYYFVKRAYSPVLASLIRREDKVDVWIVNDTSVPVEGEVLLKLQNLHGEVSFSRKEKIVIAPNSSSEVLSQDLNDLTIEDTTKEFFSAEFLAGGESVSINTLFLERFKHVELPRPDLKVEITQANTTGRRFHIRIFSTIFAKAVYLHIPDTQVSYSDNYFDVLPKATKTVIATTDRKMNMRKIRDLLVVSSILTDN